jgi:hypothetical protein
MKGSCEYLLTVLSHQLSKSFRRFHGRLIAAFGARNLTLAVVKLMPCYMHDNCNGPLSVFGDERTIRLINILE